VVAEGLTKRFDSFTAVDHLNFQIEEGEVFGLLGPNGAGKTTTLRMLSCLISPSEGGASVSGFNILHEPLKVRKSVGILTENPSLYERLSALENMEFFAEAYGLIDKQERNDRIRELLEFFSLWDRRSDKVATFSKGMKQKLAIVRATLHNPPVLFLDEPTAGLDPESAKEIRDLMARLSKHEKRTILLCTHHLEDAEKLCKRVMILSGGKTVVVGTIEELRDKTDEKPLVKIGLKNLGPKFLASFEKKSQLGEMTVNESESVLSFVVDDADESTPELVKRIVKAGGEILSVSTPKPSLEEVYLKLIRENS